MSFEVGPSGRAFTLVICDCCGIAEEYADGRTHVVSDTITERGWRVDSNDWMICPDCTLHSVAPDDEGEQFLRDREIDIRISPSGEPL